jgi:zinc/manganese transport system substrate-binding protein
VTYYSSSWGTKMQLRNFFFLAFIFCYTLPAFAHPLHVVASISILGDLVKQVGGDTVEVTTLVGPDQDAHAFQPTPADGKKILHASIVFVNGLGLEGWMDRLIISTEYKGSVISVSKGINRTLTLKEDDSESAHKTITDPHAWQNIANTRIYIKNIAEALIVTSPENAALFREKASVLDKELAELDMWVKTEIATVPPSKRKVISSHDAFGYFAQAYGITFMAPVGINTEAEPSAKMMAHLIEQIRKNGVKAIFFENMMNQKLVKQLTEEAGATVGPPLYADALSSRNGPASNYQSMIKYNVTKLVEGMQRNQ